MFLHRQPQCMHTLEEEKEVEEEKEEVEEEKEEVEEAGAGVLGGDGADDKTSTTA